MTNPSEPEAIETTETVLKLIDKQLQKLEAHMEDARRAAALAKFDKECQA